MGFSLTSCCRPGGELDLAVRDGLAVQRLIGRQDRHGPALREREDGVRATGQWGGCTRQAGGQTGQAAGARASGGVAGAGALQRMTPRSGVRTGRVQQVAGLHHTAACTLVRTGTRTPPPPRLGTTSGRRPWECFLRAAGEGELAVG